MKLRSMGEALDSAVDKGYLPDTQKQSPPIAIYRRRLRWLGYLKSDSESTSIDAEFIGSLKQFQKDLGFVASGLMGKKTYHALESLVAFDSDADSLKFVSKLEMNNMALIRAVKLRLSSYGIEKKHLNSIHSGLGQFKLMIRALRLTGTHVNMTDRECLKYLFNLDSISSGVRGSGKFLDVVLPSSVKYGVKKKKFLASLDIFLRNIAAIELWLYGYNINIKKLQAQKVDISKSLKAFWKETPVNDRPPKKEQDHVTLAFFQRINQLQKAPSTKQLNVVNHTISEHLANESFKKEVEIESASLVSRLVDGAKRIIKAIVNFARGIIKGILSFVRNAARWILSKGKLFYDSLKTIIKAGFVGLEEMPHSNSIKIVSDFDRDLTVLVSNNLPSNASLNFMKKYQVKAQLKRITLLAFLMLLKIFKSVKTIIVTGWLSILWALTRLGESIKEVNQLAIRAKEYLRIYKELSQHL